MIFSLAQIGMDSGAFMTAIFLFAVTIGGTLLACIFGLCGAGSVLIGDYLGGLWLGGMAILMSVQGAALLALVMLLNWNQLREGDALTAFLFLTGPALGILSVALALFYRRGNSSVDKAATAKVPGRRSFRLDRKD